MTVINVCQYEQDNKEVKIENTSNNKQKNLYAEINYRTYMKVY